MEHLSKNINPLKRARLEAIGPYSQTNMFHCIDYPPISCYSHHMTIIANPIYDVVFKYLLEDKPSAILLLSALMGEEILDLELLPREQTYKVNRVYTDATTGREIQEKEEFIESLSHDSIIVQIAYIKDPYKTELEKLLSIFDQTKTADSVHKVLVDPHAYPDKYQRLIKRLRSAITEQEIEEIMYAEDDILKDFQNLERRLGQKDHIIEAKERQLKEKEKEINDKTRTIAETKKALAKKTTLLQEKEKLIRDLMDKLQGERKNLEESPN